MKNAITQLFKQIAYSLHSISENHSFQLNGVGITGSPIPCLIVTTAQDKQLFQLVGNIGAYINDVRGWLNYIFGGYNVSNAGAEKQASFRGNSFSGLELPTIYVNQTEWQQAWAIVNNPANANNNSLLRELLCGKSTLSTRPNYIGGQNAPFRVLPSPCFAPPIG